MRVSWTACGAGTGVSRMVARGVARCAGIGGGSTQAKERREVALGEEGGGMISTHPEPPTVKADAWNRQESSASTSPATPPLRLIAIASGGVPPCGLLTRPRRYTPPSSTPGLGRRCHSLQALSSVAASSDGRNPTGQRKIDVLKMKPAWKR